MDEAAITKYVTDTFAVDVVVALGATFFFYDPGNDRPKDHKFPFATLVTSDEHDSASDLNRPGVFRLNVGVSKQTYGSLFGSAQGHDYTALDRIMPHPVYGKMYWICVLNPTEATFQTVRPLLAEAYEMAARKHARSPTEE